MQRPHVITTPFRLTDSRRLCPGRFRAIGMALLFGFFLSSSWNAEAGLLDKIKAKQRAKKEQIARSKIPKQASPRPQVRSYYNDAHNDAYINHALLAGAGEAPRKIVVDIGRQRAFLIIHGLVAIDTAVSTARGGKYTPRGTFPITERVQTGKTSSIYHVYMPYWMRLGNTTVGMHVGDLPGYPASAGCIRLPQSVGPILFENTSRGVLVEVVDSWDEKELMIPYSIRKPTAYTDT